MPSLEVSTACLKFLVSTCSPLAHMGYVYKIGRMSLCIPGDISLHQPACKISHFNLPVARWINTVYRYITLAQPTSGILRRLHCFAARRLNIFCQFWPLLGCPTTVNAFLSYRVIMNNSAVFAADADWLQTERYSARTLGLK